MNDNPVMQRVREFHQEHGPECYGNGSEIFYPDGAMRDANPIGVLMPPPSPDTPEGEFKLAHNKLTFTKLKLQVAVKEFDALNTRLEFTYPADPDTELAKLKELQKIVHERKQLVKKAETALEQTAWMQKRAADRQRREEEQQRIVSFQTRRRAIRV